uniref:Ubiquitin-like protease family profile domain-containing protein n=1 Tax=Panagrolaimus davidi TaxID=227884 RepID=A0A914QU32_9BILA
MFEKTSEGSRNHSCDQQEQQQPRECNASRDVCMESMVKEFDGGNIEQKTSNNDTIELDDNDDEEGIKYELGQDHPTTQHLQRLIKNEYLDDSIIMRVLQDLRMGMESVVLIDAIIWTDGFVSNFWGPRQLKPKGRAKLPTIPYYDEKWETAVAPINISFGEYKHWTLAVIKKKLKKITYFDPLKDDLPHGHLIKLLAIAQLMVGSPCEFVPAAPESFMTQTDGYNCGVIACLLARSYLLHLSPFWSQKQLAQWRQRVHDWIKNDETEPLDLGF